jgi:hypothetical protein
MCQARVRHLAAWVSRARALGFWLATWVHCLVEVDTGGPAIARFRVIILLLWLLPCAGCSSESTGGAADAAAASEMADDAASDSPSCPNDLPPDSDCPPAAPSYGAAVAPIIAARCSVCHRPGGLETSMRFSTYADAFALRRQMLTTIYACRMPPAGAVPLSTDERQTLLKWFVCGAPPDPPSDADADVVADHDDVVHEPGD